MGRRAILERNVRAGHAETLSYEVPGWHTDEGDLWRPNTRVQVVDDWLRVEAEMLVARVSLSFGTRPGVHRTRLDLVRPETFLEVEYPTRERGGRWR
jgi:prophage tail gpP-like protein